MSDFILPGQKLRTCSDPKINAFEEEYSDTDYWTPLFTDYEAPLVGVIHLKTGEIRFCGDKEAIRIAEEGNNPKVNEAVMLLSPKYRKQRRKAYQQGRR
jgi:hypothetical protein